MSEWKELYFEAKDLIKVLKIKLAIAEGAIDSSCNIKSKKKKRPNDIGLKLIDGGQKFEEEPPWATNP